MKIKTINAGVAVYIPNDEEGRMLIQGIVEAGLTGQRLDIRLLTNSVRITSRDPRLAIVALEIFDAWVDILEECTEREDFAEPDVNAS